MDPSHAPFSPQLAPVEGTYQEDLLGFLGELSLDELAQIQTYFTHVTPDGDPLSDYDVAMVDLLQQAHALTIFNQDRALAQRIDAGEDVTIEEPPAWRRQATTVCQRDENGNSTGHDCVVCQNPIYSTEIRAPCGHYFGVDCVADLFQSATRDETLFPPRCCKQNIPLEQVQPHLSQELVTTFRQKEIEFNTLKRVYCSSPTCSRFLGPFSDDIGKVYTCPASGCARTTCARCCEQYSGDGTHDCRPYPGNMQVLELARAAGWARCPGCSQMVELQAGCNHMTCRCRTEFCYLCGARWNTCRCPVMGGYRDRDQAL